MFGEPSRVRAVPGGVLVNDAPFFVKGVTYNPVPPGVDPRDDDEDWQWIKHPEVYVADFKLMKKMGVNTIRIAHTSGDAIAMSKVLNAAKRLDLHVMIGHPGVQGADASDPDVQARVRTEVMRLVSAYQSHPAVLMWVIGNDANYWYPPDESVADWYRFLESLARDVKARDSNHPVATSNHGLEDAERLAALAPSVDIIGANMYIVDPAEWSRWFLPRYLEIFDTKPFIITEMGADRFDSDRGEEDEEGQARVLRTNLELLTGERARAPLAGTVVYEWNDAWWKKGEADIQDGGRDWSPTPADALRDGAFSEDWFGLVAWTEGGGRRETRAFAALQSMWADAFEASPPGILNVGSETTGAFVNVSADVVTYGDIPVNVELFYRQETGAWQRAPMARIGDRWFLELGPFDGVTILFYKVHAIDAAGRARLTSQETGRAVPGTDAAIIVLVTVLLALALDRPRRGRRP